MKISYALVIVILIVINTCSNSFAADKSLAAINLLLLGNNWVCEDDDVSEGIYRICNYFPLINGNQWLYSTGDRLIKESKTCASGYSGVRYSTTAYEYDSFMQNSENGLMFAGCQYEMPEEEFQDFGERILLIKPEMEIGETYNEEHPNLGFNFSTTLIGFESVTVPSGTYNALKVETIITHIDGSCSYKNTLWFAKNIGPVKIHRTEANPANCLGCMFVCRPDNNITLLNAPAELISSTLADE